MLSEQYLISAELLRDGISDYGTYPYCLPVVRHLEELKFHKNVTFLVGENGTGKSTLIEAIASAYGFNPEGGSRNFNFSTHDTHSKLGKALLLSKGWKPPKDGFFLRAESFYNLASNIEESEKEIPGLLDSYGGISLHDQSHGESFLSLFLHRFRGNWLYVLDEPEAALSPQRQLSLLMRMHELAEWGSQFIIATHSPILLSYPHSKIIEISESGYRESKYEETGHFILYRDFIQNSEYMLKKMGIT